MVSRWESLVVEAEDPARLARWWAEALGYQLVNERPDEVEIRHGVADLPALVFVPVPGPKQTRNRLHLNLRPTDLEAEVERLVNMGARHVDGGRATGIDPTAGIDPTMLADPEGNEFCVLAVRG